MRLVGRRFVAGPDQPFVGGIVGSQHDKNFRSRDEEITKFAAAGGADELGVNLQRLFELFPLKQPLGLLLKGVPVHGRRGRAHGLTARQHHEPRQYGRRREAFQHLQSLHSSVARGQHDRMGSNSTGTLYVVATPIGNLDDISPRACRVLDSVDLIAAEDTRRTRGLLSKFGVKTPTISCHDHNEARQIPGLLERLQRGESVALVSDAGTPLLSDPGLLLVRAVHDAGVPVIAVPGPSALAAALSVAGLPTDRFVFEGFLPRRTGPRRARLREPVAGNRHRRVVRIGAPGP